MMSESSKEVWAHVIPCALQHHLSQTHADSAFGGLSKDDCRIAFQYWVEHDHAESSDALKCPMLWCRKSFEDYQTTIRHNLRCPWLPNAWYWCPKCNKPERFMNTGKIEIMESGEIMMKDSIEIVKTVPTPPLRRKSSKMRKAVTFFKHCGWRNASKEHTGSSESFDGTKFGTDYKGEIDSLEKPFWEKDGYPLYLSEMDCHLNPSEIDSELMKANAELPTTEPLSELPTLPITSTVSSRSEKMINDQIYTTEPPSYCSAMQDPRFGTLECPQSRNYSIKKELAQCTCQHKLHQSDVIIIELEANETPTALPQQPAAFISEHCSQMEIPELSDPTDYISVPPLPFGDILPGVESWPVQDNRFSYISGLGTTQATIQEIYELVEIVSKEWLPRLDSTCYLVLRCSKLSPLALFYRGISAMQQCFNGSLTDSFEDIYSLVHVACAFAYLLHKDEDPYDWNALFNHMLQWQYLLSNQDDIQCFLMAMDQLRCEHSYRLTNSLSGSDIFDPRSYERTFDILRNGPVMTDCSTFLDGLEYSSLSERNMVLLPEHLKWQAHNFKNRVQYMIERITTPLRYGPDTEGFENIIDDVEFQLHAGLLRNPREVEVLLTTNARSHARSFEAFEKYRRAVIDLCDRAMEQQDSRWRNGYYSVAIDKVLAISVEISNHQTLETLCAKQDISVLAVVRPHQSDGDSPQSVTSAESESTDDVPQSTSPSTLPSTSGSTSPSTSKSTSPSTLGSSTSIPSPSIDSPNSYSTENPHSYSTDRPNSYSVGSPNRSSTDSHNRCPTDSVNSYATALMTASAGSPSSPAPQTPTADVLRCPMCPTTFKPTSGATNLQRHLKCSNAHGLVQKYECHIPGCGKTYNRTDNLNHHIRTVHNESPPVSLQRRGAQKRRRESDDTADIRPKGIRPKGMRPGKAVILQGQNFDIREKYVF